MSIIPFKNIQIIMNDSKNKYNYWVFTLSQGGEYNSLSSAHRLKEVLELKCTKFAFQLERGTDSKNLHYQGCFQTRIRTRQPTILYALAVELSIEPHLLQINRMQGTWDQSIAYCSKEDTQVEKPVLSDSIVKAENAVYKAKDLEVFKTKGFRLWQTAINNILFEIDTNIIKYAESRKVYWIADYEGNTGKSLFTKTLCYHNENITKLAFGSGSQMRSAVIEEGPKQVYIIDIPRKLCNDDFQNNIYSVIEDLKNGFIKSSMYGKPKTLFMEPPIVIIFSNSECPVEQLSVDRWIICSIIGNKLYNISEDCLME